MFLLSANRLQLFCATLCAAFLGGCAFDVISIRQVAANFRSTPETQQVWTLSEAAHVGLEQGYASDLRKGTRWRQLGRIEQGDVFHTADQIIFVEASNQHEAELVVNKNFVVGFYLPVEHTFTPAYPPVEIKITPP